MAVLDSTRLAGDASLTIPARRVRIRSLPLSMVGDALVWLVLAIIIVVVAIVPLVYTIDSAFYRETIAGLAKDRSLTAVINVYTTARYLGFLAQALILAGIVTALALTFGVTMAFLIARTDMPGRSWLEVLVVSPLFLSPFTGLIAWIVLGSVKTGFINVGITAFFSLFGVDVPPIFNIWSYTGVIWVMVLFFSPFAFLFTISNLRAMDSSLEESARTTGASPFSAVWHITLPMMVPSIFAAGLLIFVLAAEMYSIPGIIGSTAGFTTLPWQIYLDSTVAPVHRAHAAAAGTILLWVTILGIVMQRRITRVSERFVTVGGKGHRSREFGLGPWRWIAFAFVAFYVFSAVVLPIGALTVFSLMKFSSVTFTADLFTLKHYQDLFKLANTTVALKNTLMLGVLAGAVCVVVGSLVSYMEVRRPSRIGSLIALLGVIPVAVPGIVYGIGLLWTYLRTPIYGTVWVLLLAYLAKFLPYAIVVSRTGILQINRELEECARVSGANAFKTLLLVTAPLIKATLIVIFFFVMLMSIKELSASILLYTERGPVLSVLTWSYMDTGNFQFAAAIGVLQSFIMVALVVLTRLVFRIRLEKAFAKS